jgi:hypothetical protein
MTNIARSGDYRTSNPTSIGEPEKVTSWPFKEPTKKSAWNDNDKPEAPAPASWSTSRGRRKRRQRRPSATA